LVVGSNVVGDVVGFGVGVVDVVEDDALGVTDAVGADGVMVGVATDAMGVVARTSWPCDQLAAHDPIANAKTAKPATIAKRLLNLGDKALPFSVVLLGLRVKASVCATL